MGTPHRVYYIQPSLASNASVFVGREGELYTYIGVGLSALLVSTCRAMRRPFYRGTSSRTGSTLFIYINPELLKILNAYYGAFMQRFYTYEKKSKEEMATTTLDRNWSVRTNSL